MSTKIRMQADDFLNAYQILNKKSPVPCSPNVVCLAFAVELYIKDLHFALAGKAPRGHNILKLFEGLPKEIQQEIFAYDAISQNPFVTSGDIFSPKRGSGVYSAHDGFIDAIKAISDAFVQWRYPYEAKRASLTYDSSFAEALIQAVKSVADRRRTGLVLGR